MKTKKIVGLTIIGAEYLVGLGLIATFMSPKDAMIFVGCTIAAVLLIISILYLVE